MTDEKKVADPSNIREGVDYRRIECPDCLAWVGQHCRNPKNLRTRPAGVFCENRVKRINENADRQAAELARDLEYAQKRIQHYADQRVSAFFADYTKLVQKHKIALSHEDGHGAFQLSDTNLDHLLTWALQAEPKLTTVAAPPLDNSCAYLERLTEMQEDFNRVVSALNWMRRIGKGKELEEDTKRFQLECAAFMATNLEVLRRLIFGPEKESDPRYESFGDWLSNRD